MSNKPSKVPVEPIHVFNPSLDLVNKQPEVREADDDVADLKSRTWDLPGGPVAKNLLTSAGDTGSIWEDPTG